MGGLAPEPTLCLVWWGGRHDHDSDKCNRRFMPLLLLVPRPASDAS